jgi:hypothetical protein
VVEEEMDTMSMNKQETGKDQEHCYSPIGQEAYNAKGCVIT